MYCSPFQDKALVKIGHYNAQASQHHRHKASLIGPAVTTNCDDLQRYRLMYGNQQHLPTTTTEVSLCLGHSSGFVFSYKLRYIVGFGLVGMAISIYPKPTCTIYRNLCENTGPDSLVRSGYIFNSSLTFITLITSIIIRFGYYKTI